MQSALAPRSDNARGRRITSQLDTITQRTRPTGDNSTDRTSAKEPAVTDERRRTEVTSADLGQVDRSLQDGETEGGRSADRPKLTRRQDNLPEYDTVSAEQVERRYRPENSKSGRAAANGNISVDVDQRSSTAARELITVTDTIDSSLDEAVSLNCDRLSAGEQASAVTAVITRSGARQRAARNETATDEQDMAKTDATDDRRTVDETEATLA